MKKLWIFKMILFFVASIALMSAVLMWLWNWLVPEIFQGPVISFWHAAGLLVLSRIIFRGFLGKGGRKYACGDWKNRWSQMSQDDKEKVRSLWKIRCENFEKSKGEVNAEEQGK